MQEEKYRESKGGYLPNIFFDASYIRAKGGRTIEVPAGDLVNPAYHGLNNILGEDRYPTDIANASEQLLPDNFHETKIRLIQPVINSKIWLNAKAQSLGVQIEEAKKDALENKLIAEIKTAYFSYLSAMAELKIYKENRRLLDELLKFNESLVKHGKATTEIVLDVKAQRAELETQLFEARTKRENAKGFFNFLIERELKEDIVIDSTVTSIEVNDYGLQGKSSGFSQKRPEIQQLETSLELSRTKVKLANSYLIPQLSILGDVGYQGFGYSFDGDQDFYFLRAGLTWPIFQGLQNRRKVQKARIAKQKISNQLYKAKKSIDLEIQRAQYTYQQAIFGYDAAKVQLRNRERSFQIIYNKYRNGVALPVSLETARVNLLSAKLKREVSKYKLLIAETRLEASLNQEIHE